MKTKNRVVAAFLCTLLMAGCAKTPDEAIVRKKGSQSIENYKEAKQDTSKEEAETSEGGLSSGLEVPEQYQNHIQSEDGNFQLTCDASIHIPSIDHISVYRVGQQPFDENIIEKITQAFFGDNPVYDGNQYFAVTKEEALKKLEELKGYQAAGNEDPYGLLAEWEESGQEFVADEVYSLQKEIDGWEQIYQDAPETVEKTEVVPQLGWTPEGEDPKFYKDYFNGAVEMDGNLFSYRLKQGAGNHLEAEINAYEMGSNNSGNTWLESYYDQYAEPEDQNIPSKEQAEEMAGITAKEAQAQADEYIRKLGLENDFIASKIQLSLRLKELMQSGSNNRVYDEAGYMLHYVRAVDGVPVTYESNGGGGLESMESTLETWGYEAIDIVINKEGLRYASILNLYQLGEKQVENVELKNFPEIARIFEQMIQIKNADMESMDKIDIKIQDVTLGYMRIYDPGADHTSGLLVPVWDFFGSEAVQTSYEGEPYSYMSGDRNSSLLTINAVDGTIIDRGLGY